MNESYQEAAKIESKNLGEGTAEYNRMNQNILSTSFNMNMNNSRIIPTNDNSF